jgi:hypothetical protein
MRIIKVEVPDQYGVGVCENCKQLKQVRSIHVAGIFDEDRGYYKICFDCFGPSNVVE